MALKSGAVKIIQMSWLIFSFYIICIKHVERKVVCNVFIFSIFSSSKRDAVLESIYDRTNCLHCDCVKKIKHQYYAEIIARRICASPSSQRMYSFYNENHEHRHEVCTRTPTTSRNLRLSSTLDFGFAWVRTRKNELYFNNTRHPSRVKVFRNYAR